MKEFDLLCDTLYNSRPKIYTIDSNEIDQESAESFLTAEWCPNKFESEPSVAAAEPVPDSLPAREALNWKPGHMSVDIRPHMPNNLCLFSYFSVDRRRKVERHF